ncbi:uncharacterized protein LOC119726226 [Patiria miniata]|uniref:Cyclic nucleotide-binding domain-containing protein n=1 Tax=Patiria miniata TaxID=46514 RepID=A0A913ZRJ0_PATMI|nr:uncharacterized protein LOC119726226 [Patiria miniata]
MVLWRSRRTVSVMEPMGDAELSPPSSEASGQASQVDSYTVPPASPVESTDPITAVQRANSPERTSAGRERKTPCEWELRRPQTVQLSVKSKTVQNSFPAKPSRARFVKTKARTVTSTKNSPEGLRLSISGNGSREGAKSPLRASVGSNAKLTSKAELKDESQFVSKCKGDFGEPKPGAYEPRYWTWSGKTKDKTPDLNLSEAAGDHLRERHRGNPRRARRGSVALPVNRPPTYGNHPNLREARPKSGLPAYRRVHYQLPGDCGAPRSQSGCGSGRTTERPRGVSSKSPTAIPSPQPAFASGYIAEIFQTSDKFLITRPESARQRPASARPPSSPQGAQPATHHPSRAYKVRPSSALPSTCTAKKDADGIKTRASSARIYKPRPLAESSVEFLFSSNKRENFRMPRSDSPHQDQSTERRALSERPEEENSRASLSSLDNGTSPSSTGVAPNPSSQLTGQIAPSQVEPDSQKADDYHINHVMAEERQNMVVSSCSYYEVDEIDRPEIPAKDESVSQDSKLFSPYQSSEQYSHEETSVALPLSTHHGWTNSLECVSILDDVQRNSPEDYESDANDAPDAQRPDPMSAITVMSTLDDPNARARGSNASRSREGPASARPRPRTATTRKDLEAHFQAEKRAVLEDLRSDLGRRLKLRKKSGIMSDEVFQKQIRSSFWTADMLYHRWGNDILEMRKRWKSCTGRLEDQSDLGDEEGAGPPFPRGRRGAFSNERTEESPLDFEALRSISMVNASLQRAQSLDTPSGSPTTSQVSFRGHPVARRVTTAESLRSTTPPPLSRQSSKVELRPQAPQSLSDVNVGLRLLAHAYEDPEKRRLRLRALFIETVTKIMRIARVAFCMIRSSKDLNVANFMAQLHFYNTRTMEEELTFEKEKFSRKYSKLHVPNWAREIGLKPPWDRTPDDVMALYSILKNLKSFERFTHQMRMEICRAATYSCCEKGRVILRQGHVGHNFYFIFSGSVFVQIDIEDEKTGIMTPSKTHVMEKGTSFGELALLGGGTGRRRASIICRETTELFEIEKETFLELCPDIFEKELQEKISSAKNVEIFRQFPAEDLERLCFESYIEEVAYDRVVERDTAHTDTIYFILGGKVTMLKEFDLSAAHKDTSIQAYGDKTLPAPKAGHESTNRGRQTLPQATAKNSCFMGVGELREGDCTEIALMHADEKRTSPGVILISNGVRLMQMSKRKLEKFAPKEVLDKLRRQPVQTLRIPSSEDLYKKYLVDVNWAEFKSKVVDTLQQEQKGAPIVNKPSTTKGSTGWARWPGSGVKGAPSCTVRAKSAPPRVRRRGVVSV